MPRHMALTKRSSLQVVLNRHLQHGMTRGPTVPVAALRMVDHRAIHATNEGTSPPLRVEADVAMDMQKELHQSVQSSPFLRTSVISPGVHGPHDTVARITVGTTACAMASVLPVSG